MAAVSAIVAMNSILSQEQQSFAFICSEVKMGVADGTWHHVCLSGLADGGSLAIFKDGERKYQSDGFWSSSETLGIEGNNKTN